MGVIVIRFFYIQGPFRHLHNPDIFNPGVARLIVFLDTGMNTAPAADTAAQVKGIGILNARTGL